MKKKPNVVNDRCKVIVSSMCACALFVCTKYLIVCFFLWKLRCNIHTQRKQERERVRAIYAHAIRPLIHRAENLSFVQRTFVGRASLLNARHSRSVCVCVCVYCSSLYRKHSCVCVRHWPLPVADSRLLCQFLHVFNLPVPIHIST